MPTISTLACWFVLAVLFTGSGANAQSAAPSPDPAPSSAQDVGTRALGQSPQELRAHMHAWYEDCRKGWDAKTHMSRRDYDRTCRRMAHERIKYLNEAKAKGSAR